MLFFLSALVALLEKGTAADYKRSAEDLCGPAVTYVSVSGRAAQCRHAGKYRAAMDALITSNRWGQDEIRMSEVLDSALPRSPGFAGSRHKRYLFGPSLIKETSSKE